MSDAPDPTASKSSAPTVRARAESAVDRLLQPPATTFPGYEILSQLGTGGMGVVYLARNRLLDRLEAVKLLTRPWSEERFRQEVRAAARLRHPNVVTVYAGLVTDGYLAFAMEYVEGDNLARVVRDAGPLPAPRACAYARQVALGLQHAHERGMTHRDVKPQNLMRCRADDGREVIKILDFGLAKLTVAGSPADSVTADGEFLGTPGYAAPEQLRNASAVDIRADVYGLGVTLRFLLTADREVGDAWPEGLAGVLARMTAWDPDARFQTPAAVAAALEPFTAPEARAGAERRAERAGRRAPWWLLALLVTVAGVGAFVLSPASPPPVGSGKPAPTEGPQPPRPTGFVPIFNGTDLTGWVVDGPADQWRVEDGALVTVGTRDGPRTWLLSARDYGDVRVRFEFQIEPGANSGFAFRAVPGERPVLRAGGHPTAGPVHQQVELSDDAAREWRWLPTGQVSGGVGQNAPMLKPDRPARLVLAPGWNAAEIELAGPSLVVTVNGERVQAADLGRLVAQGSLFPALGRSRGRIGFQQQAKVVRFRNVEAVEPSAH
jgi:eukaryotic-like serine/threonine-protein kinase